MRLPIIFAFFCLYLSSCGYRWEPDYPNGVRPSIAVPFVIGDEEGNLTSEIVRALNSSGLAEVRNSAGDYRLQVTILGSGIETVGYRRDRQDIFGKSRKQLLACEGRKTMTVEATLFEGDTGKVAFGPYQVSADADYDYVDGDSLKDLAFIGATGAEIIVLPFSLGQLESNETAQEASTRPLYNRIAQKIVDVIFSEW